MAQKTTDQFEMEVVEIRRTYRQGWAASHNFRDVTTPPACLASSTTESVAFTREILKLSEARMQTDPKCFDGIVSHLVKNYPGIIAGLAGFFAGLADEDHLVALESDWNEASNGSEKRSAVENYLTKAMRKGIACGLVDRFAWLSVDVVVDTVMKYDSVERILKASWPSLKPLAGVVFVKFLVDSLLWAKGWTNKNPFGKKNLTMTAGGLGLAILSAPYIAGPASLAVVMIGGNFATAYLDQLTTEWTDKNECLYQTIGRRLEILGQWVGGRLPNENRVWAVPINMDVPSQMTCLLTSNLFMEPFLLHDMVFEKKYVVRWIIEHGSHPLNVGMQVSLSELHPAQELRALCHEFARQHNLGFA